MPVPVISATMHIQTKLPVIASTPECALNPPLAAGDHPGQGAGDHEQDGHRRLMAMPEARSEFLLLCRLVFRQLFPGYRLSR